MYNFFVLGLIPGTDIQITFTMWLEAMMLVISILYLIHVHFANNVILSPTISPEAIKSRLLNRQAQLIRRIIAALQVNSAGSR